MTRTELFRLQGRSSKMQRVGALARLEALAPGAARVLRPTGKLVGEESDHPPLDTLALGMPISWKGNLQQQTRRLHREHAGKTHVQIVDFVDAEPPHGGSWGLNACRSGAAACGHPGLAACQRVFARMSPGLPAPRPPSARADR